MDPVYGYEALNVDAQERSPFSLLNWMKRMIGLRKQTTVFGRGTIEFLPARNRKILPYVRRDGDDSVLCVANLARSVQPVELDLSRFKGMTPVEMFGLTEFPRIGDQPYVLTLGPYAFYWFKIQPVPSSITARVAPETTTDVPEVPALFVGAAWETVLDGNVRTLIERDLLLPFLNRQRWFGGKSRRSRRARFFDWGLLRRGPQPLFVTIVDVEFEDGGRDQYFLPLTVRPSSDAKALIEQSPHAILANVTGARKGVLFDAWLDDTYARTILEVLDRKEQMATKRGAIRAVQSRSFGQLREALRPDFAVSRMGVEQSNTSIVFGHRLIVKMFRRLEPGTNPDLEISLQLTERAGFGRVPAVAGTLEYLGTGAEAGTLAMMQQLVPSQGDGWTHALGAVGRFYEEVGDRIAPDVRGTPLLAGFDAPDRLTGAIGGYVDTAATLGRRTAEMHLALAGETSDAAFTAEPLSRTDLDRLIAGTTKQAEDALQALAAARTDLTDEVRTSAEQLLQSRDTLLDRIRCAPKLEFVATKIRVHGDYHLGQVLWSEGDFYILDFEGEPARPLEERRLKQSPLKDVAGMIRSFGYAAYAGLFAFTSSRRSEFPRLEAWARVWHQEASAAFLRTYFALVEESLFVPRIEKDREGLLRLFVLEKALYELNYELNNRPEWARIPLRGILDLLSVYR